MRGRCVAEKLKAATVAGKLHSRSFGKRVAVQLHQFLPVGIGRPQGVAHPPQPVGEAIQIGFGSC